MHKRNFFSVDGTCYEVVTISSIERAGVENAAKSILRGSVSGYLLSANDYIVASKSISNASIGYSNPK